MEKINNQLVLVKKKKDKILILNIIIIILGTIFISLGAFHTNIWFDESYSVAISNHSFSEIWNIGGNDVHPVFYYMMLKIVSLIFGNNILVFRLFSIVPIVILSILGITHIRKEYGERTGIIFSFLTLFLPIIAAYSSEIRMYTWVMLFVTITAIYANRIYKNELSIKNWVIFALFSLLSAYTHYYGLMFAGIINVILFIYLLKNRKGKNKDLKIFIIQAIVECLLYVPWLYYFIKQLTSVGGGYWIKLEFPDTLYNVLGIQYMGSLSNIFGFCFAICLYIYLGFVIYRCKKERISVKNARNSLLLYVLIVFIAFLISLKSPILYPRYLMTITGLLIFFIADIMAKEKSKYITIEICIIIFVTSLISNINIINNNYDNTNMKQIEYLEENIKDDDIIVYSNIGNGSVFAVYFKDNKQYFYNGDHWNVEEAYKAYGPQMETVEDLDFLKDYKGRIWIIDSTDSSFYNDKFKTDDYKVIDSKVIKTKYPSSFDTNYSGYEYNLILIEK
ncbi:MAG: glycosyltransferase family 39 protein [Clostridia bacterium]|nr:glycosyltransferase family 39 protein [Clostridia bacterium]